MKRGGGHLESERGVKGALFDLDGVLLDSEPVWERVRRRFVERRGGRWTDEIQRQMMGVSTAEWSSVLSRLLGGSPPPAEAASLIIGEMAAAYREALPMIDRAAAAVRRMGKHFTLGLASGSPMALIELVLEQSQLADQFDAVLSSDEVMSGKPAPDPYQELCRRLRLAPEECAAIEDSANGLRSAKAAGARVIAIPRPGYSPGPEALALADLVLGSISELTPELVSSVSSR